MSHDSFVRSLSSQVEEYNKASAPLFSYLRTRSHVGFTVEQFRIYRDNYLYRTSTTIESVARIVLAASLKRDWETAGIFAKNLFEETGEGVPARNHFVLLEMSHNIHAERVFAIPWLDLHEIDDSPFLIPEAREFRFHQHRLYDSECYLTALAAATAQEAVAETMLRQFHESLFLPYAQSYRHGEYSLVAQYFTIHLNGMEREHGELARRALERKCDTVTLEGVALESVKRFLLTQSDLWNGLCHALRDAEEASPLIPVQGRSR